MKGTRDFRFILPIIIILLISSGFFFKLNSIEKENRQNYPNMIEEDGTNLNLSAEPLLKLQWTFNVSAYVASDVLIGVSTGDGNGDNLLEIAVVGENGTLYCLNGINGSLLWTYYLVGPTYSVAFGDVNGDEKDEIIASRIIYPGPGFKIENVTVFNFTTNLPISDGFYFQHLTGIKILGVGAGDLRGISKDDVLFLSSEGQVYVFDGETNSELDRDLPFGNMGLYYGGFDINFGDVEGDGVIEYVVSGVDSGSENGSISVHRWGDGEITKLWKFILNSNTYSSTADFGDIDGDGKDEVVVGNQQKGLVKGGDVLLLNGETSEILWEFNTTSNNVYDVSCGDIHADGKDEIAIAVGGTLNATFILEGENNSILWEIPSNYAITGIELADINNDGKCEIITIGNDTIKLYCVDTDGDGLSDIDDNDDDNDNLTDYSEVVLYNTNQFLIDTDFDNLSDTVEVLSYGTNPNWWDTDADMLSDWQEINIYFTRPNNSNSDGDYLNDGEEISLNLDPNDPDTYNDGFLDSWSYFLDDDNDNLTNFFEINIYLTNPYQQDTDHDNLTDWQEIKIYNTSATNINTDGDYLTDWEEIFVFFTNPNDPDSNDDGLLDGETPFSGRHDWLLYNLITLLITTLILFGINLFYVIKLQRSYKRHGDVEKKAGKIRKILEEQLWYWGHGAKVLKNFDKLVENDVKVITLEALTRTWTQHYKKSFHKILGISEEEAADKAEEQKKRDILELYELLKDKIDIKIIPITFGKYAGSDSYQFEIPDGQSEPSNREED